MSSQKQRRRQKCQPGSSSEVYLMPVFNSPPDIEKLGRAFIAIASQIQKRENEDQLKKAA